MCLFGCVVGVFLIVVVVCLFLLLLFFCWLLWGFGFASVGF